MTTTTNNAKGFIFNRSIIMKTVWNKYRADDIMSDDLFYSYMRQVWKNAKYNSVNYNFSKLYKENYSSVLNSVNYMLKGNFELAQDFTADTFEKVLNNLCIFDSSKSNVKTWIRTISNNIVLDYFRKEKTVKFIQMSKFENPDSINTNYKTNVISVEVERDELKSNIYTAMNDLKPLYRKIAKMYFVDDMKYSTIAEKLELPLNSVKNYIHNIREILQGKLTSTRKEYLTC